MFNPDKKVPGVAASSLQGNKAGILRSGFSAHLQDGDVPGVALHGLLELAAFQALLGPDAMEVLVEVQTWTCRQDGEI